MSDLHAPFVTRCFELADQGRSEGGLPIGSVLVGDGRILGEGYNRRVQQGDPIAHGEMDCLRNAGRRPHYRGTILYTSLSPCMMCAGTIVQFGIPHVVIAENRNFGGNEDFLRERGVRVDVIDDPRCIELMARFIAEHPALWNEDIAEG
ncbi:MAG: nucleoside deaminase [Sphingomonas sp.]|jgi:cytosine deaminase|uniref:nucleoside deaminase n=1 Tax=Sphingomonas sp. TaxID=28214 RepID=UPI0035691ED4